MTYAVTISGSPSATSRSARLLRFVESELAAAGIAVRRIDIRALSPAALLAADTSHDDLRHALAQVAGAFRSRRVAYPARRVRCRSAGAEGRERPARCVDRPASARVRRIREILRGPVLSEVDVETPSGIVTSVITTRSIDELQLDAGSEVVALVKATEVSLAKL
ncbi:transporter [Pandoraea communis]|uniref:Transporter n=1 Tax=Pandoraea communis TaxID=2508297 RepID=A0A5E4UBC6_9BURK|nr:transporter [Pandoraea communis]